MKSAPMKRVMSNNRFIAEISIAETVSPNCPISDLNHRRFIEKTECSLVTALPRPTALSSLC